MYLVSKSVSVLFQLSFCVFRYLFRVMLPTGHLFEKSCSFGQPYVLSVMFICSFGCLPFSFQRLDLGSDCVSSCYCLPSTFLPSINNMSKGRKERKTRTELESRPLRRQWEYSDHYVFRAHGQTAAYPPAKYLT